MNILLIDTSKPEVLIALIQNKEMVDKKTWQGDRTLGSKLLVAIEDMLRAHNLVPKDVDRIAVHGGPGHYSALRSGVVTGTMLAMGLEKELVQLKGQTLEEMVQEAINSEPVQTVKPLYA